MENKIRLIRPNYISDFKCIGEKCDDSCCIGWSIDIDKNTFRKYFKTDNIEMKKRFSKNLYKNENTESDDIDYGQMKINKDKRCPFLNKDKLCDIYNNFGESYLSNVCYTYPRIYNVLNGVYELSLNMSCPEAVKIIFNRQDPITFIEEEVIPDRYIIHSFIDTKNREWKNSLIKNLFFYRSKSVKIVQNRNFSIEDRIKKISQEFYINRIYEGIKTDNNFSFRLVFFNESFKLLNVFNEIDSKYFQELTRLVQKSLKISDDIPLGIKSENYKSIEESVTDPFIKSQSHIFENYLVNLFFQSNFPFNVSEDPFDGLLITLFRFSFIKFYLTGLAASKGFITVDDAVKVVQVHTKTINHHNSFLSDQLTFIKDRDFDNPDFINILLYKK